MPNVFSHTNKRYEQVVHNRSSNFRASIDLQVGVYDNLKHMNCRHITFQQFCRIPFPGEVPQFIQTLFEMLTSEDLRKILAPANRENKVTRQLIERNK